MDRELVFWTMLFPLVLATLFNMTIANLGNGQTFSPIDIAVVENEAWHKDDNFKLALNSVSTGDDRLFNLKMASEDEADALLEDNAIAGYVVVDSPLRLVVNKTGTDQSILKSFLDNYIQTFVTFETILAKKPDRIAALIDNIVDRREYAQEDSALGGEPNTSLIYFYSLIAMTCFYGGFFGLREVSDIQANLSAVAARINVAPVHKMKTFLSSAAVSFLVHFTEILILLAYLALILRVDFGSRTSYVILTCFIGSVTGVSFGMFISALVKKSESFKTAILIGVSMTFSFLAGMMQHGMKYIIAQNAPVLCWINPLNLLTDAFYSLYYYNTTDRYTLNIIVILGFVTIFCLGTYFIIRRRKYASL
jgi:ABC-2 type transport system permease protein